MREGRILRSHGKDTTRVREQQPPHQLQYYDQGPTEAGKKLKSMRETGKLLKARASERVVCKVGSCQSIEVKKRRIVEDVGKFRMKLSRMHCNGSEDWYQEGVWFPLRKVNQVSSTASSDAIADWIPPRHGATGCRGARD